MAQAWTSQSVAGQSRGQVPPMFWPQPIWETVSHWMARRRGMMVGLAGGLERLLMRLFLLSMVGEAWTVNLCWKSAWRKINTHAFPFPHNQVPPRKHMLPGRLEGQAPFAKKLLVHLRIVLFQNHLFSQKKDGRMARRRKILHPSVSHETVFINGCRCSNYIFRAVLFRS